MKRISAVRAILFDIDGTLIDTVELITQALNYTYRKHLGIELPKEELRRLIGLPLKAQMHYLDERVEQPVDHEAMEADEMDYYERHRHLERVLPEGVEAVREAHRRGYRTALVTSKNRMELKSVLPRLNLNPAVDAIISADDSPRPKPAPDPVLTALQRLQVPPEEAVFIGDTVFDIACGRAAGVQVGAVGWGAHLPEDLQAAQPDYYFETPADLLNWIRQLPERNSDGKTQENDFSRSARDHPACRT
ncbi:MAG: HAD-IA family hydrolase [Fimbriimonadales bacterium]|nr:HAD-IA family hydrolase [Fimbriimonadales bacterium]